MPDFSVILQSPQVRQIVQENLLERAFHDALFPRMLFRGEASPQPWAAGIGDTQIFSAPGLVPVNMTPLIPGQDPQPTSYPMEQWFAQMNQYAGTIDTHMPTDMVAIASLFMRNAHQLGLSAAQGMNRIVRDKMYNAAESGNTVVDGNQGPVTTLRVKRLNGLTRARNPNLANASQVRFDFVSPTNPLGVTIVDNTATPVHRLITGFTPDLPGDELGSGTITISVAITTLDRNAVITDDASTIVRVGGGLTIDSITSTSIPTLADIRSAVSAFWQENVPEHPDGRFHCHLDPVSQAKIFSDKEFNVLLTALPDYYMYRQFALGELLNTVFYRNSECPIPETVVGANGVTGVIPFNPADPFAGELWTFGAESVTNSVKVHRMLFSAQGGIFEYYADLMNLVTEAGIMGKIADPRITNSGIEVFSDRIQLIIRAPQNRLQDVVSTSWKFIGDWPVRTDASTGSTARYKRFLEIQHGE